MYRTGGSPSTSPTRRWSVAAPSGRRRRRSTPAGTPGCTSSTCSGPTRVPTSTSYAASAATGCLATDANRGARHADGRRVPAGGTEIEHTGPEHTGPEQTGTGRATVPGVAEPSTGDEREATMAKAEQVTDPHANHGEGPVWFTDPGELRVVDLLAGDSCTDNHAARRVGRQQHGTVDAAVR